MRLDPIYFASAALALPQVPQRSFPAKGDNGAIGGTFGMPIMSEMIFGLFAPKSSGTLRHFNTPL
jgi:hypothetical protein